MFVFTIVFALLGQTVAYAAMSCEMMSGSYDAHVMMGHSMKQASLASDENMNMSHEEMGHGNMELTSTDCCDTECTCPVNACMSLSCLNTGNTASVFPASTELVLFNLVQQPNAVTSSLYRPPIFA